MAIRGDIGIHTVLIVEDHADVADTLALYLDLAGGFRTAVAYDGASGVEAALALRPDAVVCDLAMPGKDGLAVVTELVDRLPDRPLFIAVSAYSEDSVQDRARRAGYDHFLTKPAHPSVIEGLIQAHAREAILRTEAGSRA